MDKDTLNRRDFFKTAGAGVAAAAVIMTPREAAQAQAAAEKAALDRIASNSYPITALVQAARRTWWWRPDRRRCWCRWRCRRSRSRSGRRRWARRRCRRRRRSGSHEQSERGATSRHCHGGCGGEGQPAECPADEGEVRRDHDAGLPAVHARTLSWRDADGHLLVAVRRRRRRQHVHSGGRTAGRADSIR